MAGDRDDVEGAGADGDGVALDQAARDLDARLLGDRVGVGLAGRAGATLEETGGDRSWPGPVGTPTVAGTLPDLGWWLSGRGDGEGLTARDGDLPPVAAW